MCNCKLRGRRKGRSKVGAINIPDAAISTAMTGAEVLGGYYLANVASSLVTQQVTQLNNPTGKIVTKAAATIATVALASSKMGRKYSSDLLTIAGGMGANVVLQLVGNSLPPQVQQHLPAIGATGTPIMRNLPSASNATGIYKPRMRSRVY